MEFHGAEGLAARVRSSAGGVRGDTGIMMAPFLALVWLRSRKYPEIVSK